MERKVRICYNKGMKKIKRRPTEKQKKLLAVMSENISKRGFTKSMTKMMIEAGYAKSTARRQEGIVNTKVIRKGAVSIVKAMEIERNEAIKAMKRKRPKAKYRDLADAADKLTKNIQLLGGGETAREEHKIKWQQ